ncbi:MAG: hypothetical protein GY754_39215 [bacterium]|nr:hypothetical protein [bacterium]
MKQGYKTYLYDTDDFPPDVKAFLAYLRRKDLREKPDRELLNFAETMPSNDLKAFIHTLALHKTGHAYMEGIENEIGQKK